MERLKGLEAPYKIIHHEDRDLIVNTTFEYPFFVDYAYNLVKNGVPQAWLTTQKPSHFPYNMFVDYAEEPSYCIKRKRHSRKYYQSVVNEFSLVPKVRELVNSIRAQNIAIENGFEKLEFVEPLVGIIDRKTRDKWVMYPFVHAESDVDPRIPGRRRFTKDSILNITAGLQHLFYDNGIIPHDLTTIQPMGSFEDDPIPNTLFLTDIEAYQRIRS